MVKMKFCKKGFGERSYSSLERALRGEEDNGDNELFGGKRERRRWCDGGVMVVVVVGMKEEMEERMVEELVAEKGGDGEESGRPWEGKGAAAVCCLLEEERRKKNKREGKKGGCYIRGKMIITILPFPYLESYPDILFFLFSNFSLRSDASLTRLRPGI